MPMLAEKRKDSRKCLKLAIIMVPNFRYIQLRMQYR